MDNRQADNRREVQEAISAADDAIRHLEDAERELKSARNWGIYDILGGGLISTLIKRGKMGRAQDKMEMAKASIRTFRRELQDVAPYVDEDVLGGDFLTFADLFFDGIIADWLTQRRIGEARQQVEDALFRLRMIRQRLQQLL